MASIAEIKARLAAAKERQNVDDRPILSNPAPVQEVSNTGAVPVQEEVEVRSVTTDLQPTELVVLERPAVSGSASGEDERELEKSTNLDVTNPIHQGFIQRLADLERALLERDPLMKTHLLEIHKTMIQYEEITNLLTIDEISKIMAAQQVHTNTILVKEVVKATAKKIKDKTAKLSLGDI